MKAMILSHPALYRPIRRRRLLRRAYQGDADYLTMRRMPVIDIGCGPGHILQYLPEGTDYNGFDIDETYIAYAKRSFGISARFIASISPRLPPANSPARTSS